ncbi:MAG: PD40 domain-containing protein [Acidobacteria bacterium]|nr:PD40 domain-containing protein [Acidobacteriota bacterium]
MATQLHRLYHFGEYHLDASKRLLLRGDEVVSLTPKAFDVLLALVERHGEVVDRDMLFKLVWPDTIVEDSNINFNISVIRKTLGDQKSGHRYIATLPNRGYQFVAEVREDIVAEEGMWTGELVSGGAGFTNRGTVEESPREQFESTSAASGTTSGAGTGWGSVGRRMLGPGIAALIAIAAAVAYSILPEARRGFLTEPDVVRLTAIGRVFDAAISPDGERVAYVLDDDAECQSLWLKELASGREFEVVPSVEGRFRGVTFSPDGKLLYYVARIGNDAERSLYAIPAAGGTPRRMMSQIDSLAVFSPDARQIAFVFEDQTRGSSLLVVASVDGANRRVVAERKWPAFFSVDGPSWSPDGRLLACAVMDGPGFNYRAVAVEVASGAERPLGEKYWDWMKRVAWLPDGKGLLVLARGHKLEKNNQLWRLSYPDGRAQRISSDLSEYRGMSITANGRRLVLVATQLHSDIWIVPADNPRGAAPLTSSAVQQNGLNGIDWLPDDRIIYTSQASGDTDLWTIDVQRNKPQRLNIPEGAPQYPSASPDGRYVVFTSGRNGSPRIWRLEIATGELRQLTDGELDIYPDCSPDGQWVFYSGIRDGLRTIWKTPLAGGTAVPLTDKHSEYPAVSPDGRQVVFLHQEERTQTPQAVLMPVDGGTPQVLASMPQPNVWPQVQWTPDGKSMSYVTTHNGVSNIFRRPLAGGPDVQVTDFRDRRIFAYAWSRDGSKLAVARGVSHGDVVMFAER